MGIRYTTNGSPPGPSSTLYTAPFALSQSATIRAIAYRVIVSNIAGSVTSRDAVLTVLPPNKPPSFTKGPNVTVLEDAGPQTRPGWATKILSGPVGEPTQQVAFLVSNNNPGLFSAQPAISPDGTLSFTAAANSYGTNIVTVSLQDNGGTANGGVDTSAPQTFTIGVAAVNDAPSFALVTNEVAVAEDTPLQKLPGFALNIFAGPPNESVQSKVFVVTNSNKALFTAANQPAIDASGTLTFRSTTNATGNATGNATLTVVLRDNGGTASGGVNQSPPQTFQIDVSNVNDPPVLAALPAQPSRQRGMKA